MTGVSEFGRMCRHSTEKKVPPEPCAASTYSLTRTLTTCERASRANTAIEVTPTAIAAFVVPKPSRITMLRESRSAGIASSTSTKRMRISSTNPPTAPASTPMVVPKAKPTSTATSAPTIDSDAPYTTRV